MPAWVAAPPSGGGGGQQVSVRLLLSATLFLGLCVLPLMNLVTTGSAFGNLDADGDGDDGVAGAGAGAGGGVARTPGLRRAAGSGKIVPVVAPVASDATESEVESAAAAAAAIAVRAMSAAAAAAQAAAGGPGAGGPGAGGPGAGDVSHQPLALSPAPPPAPTPAPAWRKEERSFVVSIVGTWFGGQHHWASGKRRCPSGCGITFVHGAPEREVDAFLFHGDPRDAVTWVYQRDNLAKADDMRGKLRLYYAAENFPSAYDASALVNFNGEMSYRARSVAREVQYPLEAVGRFERVGVEVLGEAVTEAGAPAPAYMSATWADVAPAIVPWRERTHLAAGEATISWASNHCSSSSGRERYVQELLQHIAVEIYTAPCLANAPAAKASLSWADQWALWRRYKFYLAFENTRCDDYVTEKFYLALVRGQVPVVLGARNIADHAPARDAYIDVRDFASPAALAAHLHYLDTHEEAYAAYHAWRSRPFSSYGAAFRDVLRDALPVAQRDGAKAGHSQGAMFACNVCTAMAAWDDAGRPVDGSVTPFQCDAAMGPREGKWQ